MNEFDLIKDIWQSQPERKLAAEEILKQVKRSKNRLANKLLFEVFVMSLAIAALSYVWYMVPFKMWTTHLSLLIFMASCLFALFAQLSAYRSIHATVQLIGKPDTYIAAARGKYGTVDTNQFTAQIDQRTPRVTRVDRCIGLYKVLVLQAA